MAKTVKITLYSPKELWKMFCNWVFWPRRKKCAEWMDYADGMIKQSLADIIFEYKLNGLITTDKDADELYDKLVEKVKEHLKKTEELMSIPY